MIIANTFWIALLIGIVMTGVFVWGLRMRGAWGNGLAFFVIVFLTSWAAGTWVRPVTMAMPASTPWLTQLIVGLIVSLLMSSAAPAWGKRAQMTASGAPSERRAPPVTMLTPAYWVALVLLLVSVIVR